MAYHILDFNLFEPVDVLRHEPPEFNIPNYEEYLRMLGKRNMLEILWI